MKTIDTTELQTGGGGCLTELQQHSGKTKEITLSTKNKKHTTLLKTFLKRNVFSGITSLRDIQKDVGWVYPNYVKVIASKRSLRRNLIHNGITTSGLRLPRNDKQDVIKKFAAFTLAEVLITLGIIGIVAAMTLPGLLNKTKNKELHTAFLKTYAELNQIAQLIVANDGVSISETLIGNENGCGGISRQNANKIFGYFKGHSNFLTQGGQGTNDGNGNFIPYYNIHTLNGKKYSGGNNEHGSNSSFFCDNTGFKSNNSGALYILNDPPRYGDNGPVICVDINGKKGPNRYGIDYFLFIFTIDGKVIPVGQEHKRNPNRQCNSSNGGCCNFNNIGSQYCSSTSNDISKNTACAYYALTNTHPDKQGKDYWTDFLGEVYSR